MKRSTIICIIISTVIILSMAVSITIYTWPMKVDETFSGVLCRTGDSMPDYSETMTIVINGHFTKRLFNNNIFRGQFRIIEMDIDDNIDTADTELLFDKKGRGSLTYIGFFNDHFELVDIGTLYVNSDWSKLLLAIPDTVSESATEKHRHWGFDDGLILVMPSNNREEAIEIASDLLNIYYDIN